MSCTNIRIDVLPSVGQYYLPIVFYITSRSGYYIYKIILENYKSPSQRLYFECKIACESSVDVERQAKRCELVYIVNIFLRTGNGWQWNIFGKISFVQNIKKKYIQPLYTHPFLSFVFPPGVDATSCISLRVKTAVSRYCRENYTES